MKSINVFIPAAGFAERLRPISAYIPKPLLPIMGRPVLDIVLERISVLPVAQIGINAHYKWELLNDHAARSACAAKITVFHEKQILGTGGALRNAAALLRKSTFLVHNADILSGIDLGALLEKHLASGNIATLAVHDYPAINSVWINEDGLLRHVGKDISGSREGLRPVTYTGVAVYSPVFLRFLREGRSGVVGSWLDAVSSGSAVGTVDVSGTGWSDIGTPDAYAEAVFHSLSEEGEMSWVHPYVECDRISIGGRTVIERNCLFEGTARLRNCVILPGTTIAAGEHIENAVAGPGFRVPIRESDSRLLPSSFLAEALPAEPDVKINFTLIGTGGSDRRYYRVGNHEKSAVLLECSLADQDYRRQISYTRFFSEQSVPVPALIAEEQEARMNQPSDKGKVHALFEDLGDLSLYTWTKCVKDQRRTENLYRKTLDILVTLHTVVTDSARESPFPDFRIFDYNHLRWETDYFIEQFVRQTRGVEPEERALLDGEFDRLAKKVDSFPKSLIHRDFQAQNILVTERDTPRLIDYQGARKGSPAYDLASILWDPYVRLDPAMRERLIAYYIGRIKSYYRELFDENAFSNTLLPCRLQRHMQALGAYGFLAKQKGKRYFLKHVPLALSYLREETEAVKAEYPALSRLAEKLSCQTSK